MNKEELMEMAETIVFFGMPTKNKVWQKAFNLYNIVHNPPLSMSCRPCYGKVLAFHISRLEIVNN